MSDTEPPPPIETRLSTEQKPISDFRGVAEKLGDYTSEILTGAKNSGQKFLEKTWYSHQVSLFYLEGAVLKAIGIAVPEARLAGKAWTQLGVVAIIENLAKTVKVGEINVGEHMTVSVEVFRDFAHKELSDGSILRPGQKIGKIDFLRKLPTLKEGDNLLSFTKQLFRSGEQSLRELAELCEKNDPRLGDVEFFWGISHLAGPLAKRLGFDVFDIANPIKRLGYKALGKGIAYSIAKKNKHWQMFEKNFKAPHEAVISRGKLIELYGSKSETTET
jgi:hypothetical protein